MPDIPDRKEDRNMLDYKVVSEKDFKTYKEFIEYIDEMILDGWKLQGGASVVREEKPDWNGTEIVYIYFQTLIKE